jgi:ATP-dependent helicase/nuclease subunit A
MSRNADPQMAAASPRLSARVSANAGSGKTKTLVDRVARLLLNGARPEAILCVTFTKAAASEMQRRLFETLGGFAIAPDAALTRTLAKLDGREEKDHDAERLSAARRLFALALETPGGLKIQTLHAFCEKLLRQFPLEAGVSPGFFVLDSAAQAEAMRQARTELALQAKDAQSPVGAAFARLAVRFDHDRFEDLFTEIDQNRRAILEYLSGQSFAALLASIARNLGLDAPVEVDEVVAKGFLPPALDLAAYGAAAKGFAQGSEKSDRPNGRKLQAIMEKALAGEADPDAVLGLFFTGEGAPRTANFPTKQAPASLKPFIEGEQARLAKVRDEMRAAAAAALTFDILVIGTVYIAAYEAAKAAQGALDFSDLIARAKTLLNDAPQTAWVLFKLDGGIDHILVDEAQDTSPEQWSIIRALTGEFFAGVDGRDRPLDRTVFIVGDEKQSIFSFQGAAPHLLDHHGQALQEEADGAGRDFIGVDLTVSWRSTPEVLAFVDKVFEGPDRAGRLSPRLDPAGGAPVVTHLAQRAEDPGCVDLWPPVQETGSSDASAWDPLDIDRTEGAWRALAERIAAECDAIVQRGDQVRGREGWRPADYGDLLVLVKKRGPLFEETLRALKRRGVPVAGADRLKLSEHLVFKDLLSLARYALFPWDDLTLAELLRSPLCGLSDDELFALAHGRRDSLSAALKEKARDRPVFETAADLLARARDLGRKLTPFDFYARMLVLADGQDRSLRQRFLTRLGPEAAEAVDAFLAEVLAAESRHILDLERLCAEFERLDLTLKREMDAPRGEVRVMTAHGAKGLEAPIVFLADTVFQSPTRPGLIERDGGGLIWLGGAKSLDCEAAKHARQAREDQELQEEARLLYVSLTRARDRLILCGRLRANGTSETAKGWWPWLADAFDQRLQGRLREIKDPQGFTFQRFGKDPPRGEPAPVAAIAEVELPDWARRAARPDPAAQVYASPSTYGDSRRGATPSPLAATGGLGRFRRGDLIHKLFQSLPDLAADARPAAAKMLSRERDLTEEHRREIAQAALTVLEDPRFAEVFGPGSRPEAAVAGASAELPAGLSISGRVDRMVVRPDRVLVIDFKTNRPAPDRIDNADPAYITQMALYVAVLREIFKGRRIEAALIWTDGPKLMPVPENLIASSLAAVRRAG